MYFQLLETFRAFVTRNGKKSYSDIFIRSYNAKWEKFHMKKELSNTFDIYHEK